MLRKVKFFGNLFANRLNIQMHRKSNENFGNLPDNFCLSLKAIIGNYENVLILKHEETINAYEKEYLRMWETIEGIMKRKGVETEKKLELQVELDEDWD